MRQEKTCNQDCRLPDRRCWPLRRRYFPNYTSYQDLERHKRMYGRHSSYQPRYRHWYTHLGA